MSRAEDFCKQTVYTNDRACIPYQCHRKAKRDGFCNQHHPDAVKARQDASDRKYKEDAVRREVSRLRCAVTDLRERGWTVTPPEGQTEVDALSWSGSRRGPAA